VGKYHVDLEDVERVGVGAIHRAIANADIVIVDELGPMELCSTPFILAVEEALASPKPLLGTLHKRASHKLVTAIRTNPQYEIVEVTLQNRQGIPDRIAKELSGKA
jgi:nucleoside-triphosphatase